MRAAVDEIAVPAALTRAEVIPDEPIRFRRNGGGSREAHGFTGQCGRARYDQVVHANPLFLFGWSARHSPAASRQQLLELF